jgi:hypothetical protein
MLNVFFCRSCIQSFSVASTNECGVTYVLQKCNIVNPPICWDDVTSLGLQKWGKKNLQANLCRLVFGPTI